MFEVLAPTPGRAHGPGSLEAAELAAEEAWVDDVIERAREQVDLERAQRARLFADETPEGDDGVVEAALAARRLQARSVWAELRVIAELLARWAARSPLDDPDSPDDRAARLTAVDRATRRHYVHAQAADLAPAFVVAELAAACGISEYAAGQRFDAAYTLITLGRLPGTAAALRAGDLDWEKVRLLVAGTEQLSAEGAAAVEARVLPDAATHGVAAVREAITAAVLAVDAAAAAERAARARRGRAVWFRPLADAMGQLSASMGADDLALVRARLDDAAALAGRAGDARTADQVRVDTLIRAVTGRPPLGADVEMCTDADGLGGPVEVICDMECPSDAPFDAVTSSAATESAGGRGPRPQVLVTMSLETVLGLRDDPAYLAGYGPIPASMARDLAAEGIWQCAAVDEHGTLQGLGRSRYTPAYTPGRGLAEFVRTRDRFCTFPTCRARAERCDLDHRTPHGVDDGSQQSTGATCSCNLQSLCRRHHRLKTAGLISAVPSTEPGQPPGTLTWTTRAGLLHARSPVPMTPGARTPGGTEQGEPSPGTLMPGTPRQRAARDSGDADPPPF